MTNKRILLVEDDYNEIIRLQQSLGKLNGQYSLHVAHNISDALQVLMGGSSQYGMENYGKTGKVRPDIVLLNISFLQQSAREFLEVMNKYYSLKNIRVFIYGNTDQTLDVSLAERYNIAGYLTTPINLQDTINESVLRFRRELSTPGRAFFALPLFAFNKKIIALLNYLKAKTAAVVLGQAVVTKVAVSAAATVFMAGVMTSSSENTGTGKGGRLLPTRHSIHAGIPAQAMEECTEQEALVAAESISLPPLRPTPEPERTPEPALQHVQAVPEQAIAGPDRAPARQFRIVAVEETE
jgi:CheY-like chemotaxis protein